MLPPEVVAQQAGGAKAPAGPSVADEKAWHGTAMALPWHHGVFKSPEPQAALKEAGLYFQQGSGPDLNKLDDAWIGASDAERV